jgi:hypothetical protein
VDVDKKGSYILQSEVEKAVKEVRDKEATGDDDVPGDVLEVLGKDGVGLLTYLINCIYETGEWPKDFIEVTMIALKKRLKATECSDHCTYSKDSSEGT